MPKKLSIKTNFVLIGIVIGLFIGVSIEQVLGEGAGVSGTAQGNTLAVNMSGQYMNGLIVANGNALVLNGKMSIGNIDPIDVLTVTGKAQSNGLCIGTSCITNWDDLKTIFGIVVPPIEPPIDSTHNKLPPTGITFFADVRSIEADASIAQDAGAFPRQDARYARPFDYTKIANDGSILPATATLGTEPKDWACTKDNITGLIWEVKTTSGLRNKDNAYTWYNSDSNTNGGDAGTASGGTCATTGHCDTEKFAADVNGVGLCGHNSNWRLPTVKEMEGLSDFGELDPAIDPTYFPNTPSKYFFTSTLVSGVNASSYAWAVDSFAGGARHALRYQPIPVRLVHGPVSAATAYDITTVPGTAIDLRTNLMWQRCSVGQTWDGNTCVGDAQGGPWAWVLQQSVNNNFAGFTDWRAPNIKELRSLVDESREPKATINDTIFPNTPLDAFYSSSPSKLSLGDASLSWTVGFNRGVNDTAERYSGTFVRLVRDVSVNSNSVVCTGTVSTTGITKSSVTPTTSTPWSYNTSGAACTYMCDSTYTWDGSACIAQGTQITKKLPPTGITSYADLTTIGAADASIAADTGEFPRQDARYARPFDYTKIANDGTSLSATATLGTGTKDWACTKDNITGLIWEVKTTSGLRSKDNSYTWYNSDPNTNGGDAGTASSGNTSSDTEKFVVNVNASGLCGHNNWRLPTVKELEGIVDFGQLDPAIDPNYFPNTLSNNFWTSTLDSDSSGYINAWIVDGYSGMAMRQVRSVPLPVRLVYGVSPNSAYDTTTVPGTAIDSRTGLMWQRCSVGQTWDGSTCTGNAKGNSTGDGWAWVLQQSVSNKFAGFTDWRVPNIKELRSLVDEGRAYPAINTAIFPNTPVQGVYYTSSWSRMLLGNTARSWTVGFSSGGVNSTDRYSGAIARLVRDVTP